MNPETAATEELAREIAEVLDGVVDRGMSGQMLQVFKYDGEFGRIEMAFVFLDDTVRITLDATPEQARAIARAVRAVLDDRDPVEDVRAMLIATEVNVDGGQCGICWAKASKDEDHLPGCAGALIASYYEEGAP